MTLISNTKATAEPTNAHWLTLFAGQVSNYGCQYVRFYSYMDDTAWHQVKSCFLFRSHQLAALRQGGLIA